MIDCYSNLLAETPLKGGRMTAGVVRVGRTVRRPANANSDFIRRLLGHLAAKGFDGAPLPLGADESGREVFSYIEGNVPAELGIFDDDALSAAAALIRRFHDLAVDLVTNDAETVCHNDLSPCNFVFRDGLPVAIIDFDAAAPGTRAHDLGYAAWLWLDFGSPAVSPSEQNRRLRLFIASYGDLDISAVLDAMIHRQAGLAEEGRRTGNTAMAEWAAACLEWTRRYEAELTNGL
jgi:aminoglycoside phosphotransferase (APT) family kinase protein